MEWVVIVIVTLVAFVIVGGQFLMLQDRYAQRKADRKGRRRD